ncbi:PAS domain S-box protein [Rhodocytophaga rosea]|uniref:histidine kinase n=1 Tax=Rhodocytophaga rosea TaxID=2704465 RepID=A0A6C0GP55_9BACT|nr:PAS domain S-box protein [Rhodocytophaga rosea]QHT69816.1 PAS domain S-box protein [Rhodocytophaga rosea]
MANPESKLQEKLNMAIDEVMATHEAAFLQKRAQRDLLEEVMQTQQALQLALEAARMGSWEWDLVTSKITWSKALEPLHGLKPGEFATLYGGNFEGFKKLVHPQDIIILQEAIAQALEEKTFYSVEFRVIWPDGSIHWLSGQGSALYNEEGTPLRMVGIGMDITERKENEAKLRQSEERFQVAIKNSPILVFNHDKNLVYTWLYNNPRAGRSDEWVVGKTDADILPPHEAEPIMAIKRRVLETGAGTQAEIQLTLGGKLNYFVLTVEPLYDTQGEIMGITGAAFNITERKQYEEQLRKSERLKQEIFEGSADALFLVNARTNCIEDYNQQAVNLFGYKDKQELIGKQAHSLHKQAFTKTEIRKILREIQANHYWTSEVEYVSKTGREFWGNAAITLIQVDGSAYFLVRVRDITERKKAEEEIIRSQQALLIEKQRTEEALAIIAKDNERKTKELEEARALQLSMLPQSPPELKYLDIAMYMKTCVEVGGDYYDYKVDEEGNLTVILGDATGHGLKAGIVVATVKSYFQTLANQCTVSELLARISEGIQNLQIRGMYMGVTVIKIRECHLTIASSGMPPLYLYNKVKNSIEQITLKGLFLGSTIPFPYQYTYIPLNPGDTLLALSDGLPELFNADREMLGYERIQSCFKAAANLPAEQIIKCLNQTCEEWAAGHDNEDDMSVIVIKAKE